MEFQIIETERLLLRRLLPEELHNIFTHFDEPAIKRLLDLYSDAEYQKEKARFEKGYTTYNRSFARFQLISKETKLKIGNCGFHTWYTEHDRAEIGYDMSEDKYKQQGYMSEALEAIIHYGFSDMRLHRIEAMVGTKNTASLRLMQKFGFVQEGLLREHYFTNGVYEDSVIFSKLSTI